MGHFSTAILLFSGSFFDCHNHMELDYMSMVFIYKVDWDEMKKRKKKAVKKQHKFLINEDFPSKISIVQSRIHTFILEN